MVENLLSGPRTRLVARLDIKAPNLVKGVQLEGLRVIGNPNDFATKYANEAVDELFLDDIVASLFGRNSLNEIIAEITKDVFIPITVGGGLRTVEDVAKALRHGADKVSINSGAVSNPSLISEVAASFGRQCVVVSIQSKWSSELSTWEVMTESGRERSGLSAIDWAKRAEEMGAGEIFVTSVDRDGTRRGFDVELSHQMTDAVDIPVVVGGGFGQLSHITELLSQCRPSGIAIGSALHLGLVTSSQLKSWLSPR